MIHIIFCFTFTSAKLSAGCTKGRYMLKKNAVFLKKNVFFPVFHQKLDRKITKLAPFSFSFKPETV